MFLAHTVPGVSMDHDTTAMRPVVACRKDLEFTNKPYPLHRYHLSQCNIITGSMRQVVSSFVVSIVEEVLYLTD
jgi:hypothetical protein